MQKKTIKQEQLPVKCQCGKNPKLIEAYGTYWVECIADACWIGPEKITKIKAIKAWNKIMEKK